MFFSHRAATLEQRSLAKKGHGMNRMTRFAKSVAMLYVDGFRNMKVGKKLWLLITIKLFVMFAVLKVFFFPNVLKENFSSDAERAEYILNSMIEGE